MGLLLLVSILNAVLIIAIGGASSVLTVFIIPIIKTASNTRTMISQFALLIHKGETYLQTASRTSTVCFLAQSIVAGIQQHEKDSITTRGNWKILAICCACLLQIAWYEVVFVFPINDRMLELGQSIDATATWAREEVDKKYRKDVLGHLDRWATRNIPRFVIPLVVGTLAISDLAR